MKTKKTLKMLVASVLVTTMLVGTNSSFVMADINTVSQNVPIIYDTTEEVTENLTETEIVENEVTENLNEEESTEEILENEVTETEIVENEEIEGTTSNPELVVETPEEYDRYYHYAVYSAPNDGATNVPTDLQLVTFEFDYGFPLVNFEAANMSVTITHYENGVKIVEEISPSNVELTAIFAVIDLSYYNFLPNTEYTVDFFFFDMNLNLLLGMFDYWVGSTTFTTAPTTQNPAQVKSTTPNLDNTTINYEDGLSQIKINFDKQMNTSKFGDVKITDNTQGTTYTLDKSKFYWENNKTCVVDARYTDSSNIPIQMGHSYTLTISNFKDVDGFTSTTKSYNFNVSDPRPAIESTTPDFSSGYVDSYIGNIVITFDKPMNTNINGYINIIGEDGTQYPINTSEGKWINNQVFVQPVNMNLASVNNYSISIEGFFGYDNKELPKETYDFSVNVLTNVESTTPDFSSGSVYSYVGDIVINFDNDMNTDVQGKIFIDGTDGSFYDIDETKGYWKDSRTYVQPVNLNLDSNVQYGIYIGDFQDVNNKEIYRAYYDFEVLQEPHIESITPDFSSGYVNPYIDSISITFSEPMYTEKGYISLDSLDENNSEDELLVFSLDGYGVWSNNDTTVTFSNLDLMLDENVKQPVVVDGVYPNYGYIFEVGLFKTKSGTKIETEEYLFGTTNPELDPQAKVTGTSITNGQSDVPTNLSEITIDFSHAMNPNIPVSTENVRLVNLSDGSTQEDNLDLANAVWSNGNKTLTIPLDSNLKPQTLYQVEIDGLVPQSTNVSPTELYEVSFFTTK